MYPVPDSKGNEEGQWKNGSGVSLLYGDHASFSLEGGFFRDGDDLE